MVSFLDYHLPIGHFSLAIADLALIIQPHSPHRNDLRDSQSLHMFLLLSLVSWFAKIRPLIVYVCLSVSLIQSNKFSPYYSYTKVSSAHSKVMLPDLCVDAEGYAGALGEPIFCILSPSTSSVCSAIHASYAVFHVS